MNYRLYKRLLSCIVANPALFLLRHLSKRSRTHHEPAQTRRYSRKRVIFPFKIEFAGDLCLQLEL